MIYNQFVYIEKSRVNIMLKNTKFLFILLLILIMIVGCSNQNLEIEKASYLAGYKTYGSFASNKEMIIDLLNEEVNEIITVLEEQDDKLNTEKIDIIIKTLKDKKLYDIDENKDLSTEIDEVIEILEKQKETINIEKIDDVISFFKTEKEKINSDIFSVYMINLLKNQGEDLSAVNWKHFQFGYLDALSGNSPKYKKIQ